MPRLEPLATRPFTTFALPLLLLACACTSDADGGSGGGGSGGDGSGGEASGGTTSSGGVPGDGGSQSTGGAAGSGGGADVVGCNRPDLILCEDFESTAVGAVPNGWSSEGTVAVADDQTRGERSLKIGAQDNGWRRIYRNAESLGSAHWGRIHYRVQTPTPEVFVHSTLVQLDGNGPELGEAGFRVVDTVQNAERNHQFLFNVQPQSSDEYAKGSSYDWTFESEWHCAEWHIDGDNQRYRFFFDGEEVTQIAIDNGPGNYGSEPNRTHIPASFTNVSVGWNNYQPAAPGFVAWLDDLAIAASRVGCD